MQAGAEHLSSIETPRRKQDEVQGMSWRNDAGDGSIRSSTARSGEWRQPAPAAPRHSRPPLPLLPSGPDGVHDLAMRGDRCGPPSTVRFIAKAGEDITGCGGFPDPASTLPRAARADVRQATQARATDETIAGTEDSTSDGREGADCRVCSIPVAPRGRPIRRLAHARISRSVDCAGDASPLPFAPPGEVSERSKEHAWKVCVR